MSETEKATVELTKAQRAQVVAQTAQLYIDMQALQPEEVRRALAKDEQVDVEGILDNQPENPQEEGLTVVRNYKSCGWGRERCDR